MFNPDQFMPLELITWDEQKVRETIAAIARDAIAAFDGDSGWPKHPMEERGGHDFYLGSTGALWGIDYLQSLGACDSEFAVFPLLPKQIDLIKEGYPNLVHSDNTSYFISELPVLMLQFKREASARVDVGHGRHPAGRQHYEAMDGGASLAAGISAAGTTDVERVGSRRGHWASLDTGALWRPA